MNLKWKPTKMSLELSRRLFGPDRAEVTERSNNVGPDIDDAIHKRRHRSTDYIVATKIGKTLTPCSRERGMEPGKLCDIDAAKRRPQTENWEVRVVHSLSRADAHQNTQHFHIGGLLRQCITWAAFELP